MNGPGTKETKSSQNKQAVYRFNKSQLAWLEDLESGDFKRCYGQLCSISKTGKLSFCCLGLACERFVSKKNIEVLENDFNDDGKLLSYAKTYEGQEGKLPNSVVAKLKLHNDCGAFSLELLSEKYKRKVDGNLDLASLNDDGWSFKEIAKFIKENTEAVFAS